MKKQYQITQIENGWLVSYVDDGQLKMAMAQGNQVAPRVEFCKDFNEVCAALKDQWPAIQD